MSSSPFVSNFLDFPYVFMVKSQMSYFSASVFSFKAVGYFLDREPLPLGPQLHDARWAECCAHRGGLQTHRGLARQRGGAEVRDAGVEGGHEGQVDGSTTPAGSALWSWWMFTGKTRSGPPQYSRVCQLHGSLEPMCFFFTCFLFFSTGTMGTLM